jgi:hypothetical protein
MVRSPWVLKQDVLLAAGVVMNGYRDYRMVDDDGLVDDGQYRRLLGITLLGFRPVPMPFSAGNGSADGGILIAGIG